MHALANDIASIGADVFCCRVRSAGIGGRGDRSSLCNDVSRYRAGSGPPSGPAKCIPTPVHLGTGLNTAAMSTANMQLKQAAA